MERAPSLVGRALGGAYFADAWEIRITERCLVEDLGVGPDEDFSTIQDLPIVKAAVRERSTKTTSTRQLSPVSCGCKLWVLGQGHDHRGVTWFDEEEGIVWLLAYGLHRSGAPDDFFPYAKQLDADDRLLPTAADYARAFTERGEYFAWAVTVEAPGVLADARATAGEHRHVFGGHVGTAIDIEVVPEAEAITIAFNVRRWPWEHAVIIMAALAPNEEWVPVERMPSRDLVEGEVAMTVLRET